MNSILADGEWRAAKHIAGFEAFDPKTAQPLPDRYPVSAWEDCDAAMDAAVAAGEALDSIPASQIAAFLDRYADRLETHAADITCARIVSPST